VAPWESGAKRSRLDHWESFEDQGRYFDQSLNTMASERRRGYLTEVLTDHAVE
jgi:hypothetical protein